VPRYFFLFQTETRTSDHEGLELDGDTAARAQAIITCGQMIKDAPEGFWGTRPWSVTVTDVTGLVLYEINVDGNATRLAAG
jgi:hypothetical protein